MNTTAITIAAILAVTLPAVCWQIHRARNATPSAPGRQVWNEDTQRWTTAPDEGPAAQQLLQALGLHLDEYVLADPELAAGFDRLRQAVRDEQNKGEA